ncbi:MAG: hypothetical protein OXH71_00650 [Candidatus Dadabacteria bacterium]|nr:hypothetical protein [Candidatus Dadabacteria bacterium]
MSSVITVRNIDPGDKSWLRREARRQRISMEELVRRMIHERRAKLEAHVKLSEAFRNYFGPDHGVELPLSVLYGYRSVLFQDENQP